MAIAAPVEDLQPVAARSIIEHLRRGSVPVDQVTYFTVGPKEARAWTIVKGTKAPQAAGVIHGDFERGFIAAEVVDCDDLLAAGSHSAAKAAGKVRTEGKTYIMQPDDVVEFKFNV